MHYSAGNRSNRNDRNAAPEEHPVTDDDRCCADGEGDGDGEGEAREDAGADVASTTIITQIGDYWLGD